MKTDTKLVQKEVGAFNSYTRGHFYHANECERNRTALIPVSRKHPNPKQVTQFTYESCAKWDKMGPIWECAGASLLFHQTE